MSATAAAAALLLLLLLPVAKSEDTEASALLLLKKSFTNASALSSWVASTNPCGPPTPWAGVVCNHGAIIGLRLSDMGLGGTIDATALSGIQSLRSLRFSHNSLSGPMPAIDGLSGLRSIYFDENEFSEEIPSDLFKTMFKLKRLYLSFNNFTRHVPRSLGNCTNLVELHLESNQFQGKIPNILLPHLRSFNISDNMVEGTIPPTFQNFSSNCFANNIGLNVPGLDNGMLPGAADDQSMIGPQVQPAQPGQPAPMQKDGPPTQPKGNKMAGVYMVLVLLGCVLVVGLASIRKRNDGFERRRDDGFDSVPGGKPQPGRRASSVQG